MLQLVVPNSFNWLSHENKSLALQRNLLRVSIIYNWGAASVRSRLELMHCTEELSTIHWLWLTNSTATQLSSVRSRIIRCCSAFGFVLTEANISSPRWWHWLAIYPIQDQSAVSTTAAVRSALTKERVSSKSFPKFSTNTHARTVPVTFSLSLRWWFSWVGYKLLHIFPCGPAHRKLNW